MKKFDKNTKISKLLGNTEFEKVLKKFNFPCLTCPMAQFEISFLTLGQVTKSYGLNLQKILDELNKLLKKKKSKNQKI